MKIEKIAAAPCGLAVIENRCLLHTTSGAHALVVEVANGFLSRFKGLMLTPPLAANRGLLITRCASVHCAFMRYSIDVIYLSNCGTVLECVSEVKPWRASMSRGHSGPASHALELAAGSIERLQISAGDRLEHAHLSNNALTKRRSRSLNHEDGSAMMEFVVVGPIITLFGLAMLQYGMLFFAKNQINHASFMAARAGSMANANLDNVQRAYASALVPLYGGGQDASELAASLVKANTDLAGHVRIELLNPTKESFDDWNAPALQKALQTGAKRVIPNSNQGFKSQDVGATSGQTIQDANLIKLRITQGYMPKVPVVANIYRVYLKWLDPKTDAFHTDLVSDGRIPIVTSVTLQMQSDAVEGTPISLPGPGNGGSPVDPGAPPVTNTAPPDCANISCAPPRPPAENAPGPGTPGGPCKGPDCSPCNSG